MAIHATAQVASGAVVDATAEVGPFCVVGADVELGPRTRLLAHNFVEGKTAIGADNVFHPYSTVGVAPQDLKYEGEASETRIGDRNQIREFVTIHRGTSGGGMLTSIGDDNLLQAYAHVAHDCHVGSDTILAHSATLGGHVTVEDHAVVGAHSGVHQFCRVGQHCYIGGYSVITQDVLPFSLVVSERSAKMFSVNKVGLERRGFTTEQIQALHILTRTLTKSGLNVEQAVEKVKAEVGDDANVRLVLEFIAASDRGFIR